MVSVKYFFSTRARSLPLLGFLFCTLVWAQTPPGNLVGLAGRKVVSVHVGGKSIGSFRITYNSATKVVRFNRPKYLLAAIEGALNLSGKPVLPLLEKGVLVTPHPPQSFEEARRRKISAVYRPKNAALSLFLSPVYIEGGMKNVGYSVPISSIFLKRFSYRGVPSIAALMRALNKGFGGEEEKAFGREALAKRASDEKVFIAEVPRASAARAPTARAPRAPAPVGRAPRAPAPVGRAPRTSAPVGRAPRTSAPVARAPRAPAPVGRAPRTSAPVGRAPRAFAPVGRAPRALAPVGRAPRALAPITQVLQPSVVRSPVPVIGLTTALLEEVDRRLQKTLSKRNVNRKIHPNIPTPRPNYGIISLSFQEAVDRRLQRTLRENARRRRGAEGGGYGSFPAGTTWNSSEDFPYAKTLPSGPQGNSPGRSPQAKTLPSGSPRNSPGDSPQAKTLSSGPRGN